MPASSRISRPAPSGTTRGPGRPKGSRGGSKAARLRDILLSHYSPAEIIKWFNSLAPREKLDILVRLEPKAIEGAGEDARPIILKWQD